MNANSPKSPPPLLLSTLLSNYKFEGQIWPYSNTLANRPCTVPVATTGQDWDRRVNLNIMVWACTREHFHCMLIPSQLRMTAIEWQNSNYYMSYLSRDGAPRLHSGFTAWRLNYLIALSSPASSMGLQIQRSYAHSAWEPVHVVKLWVRSLYKALLGFMIHGNDAAAVSQTHRMETRPK